MAGTDTPSGDSDDEKIADMIRRLALLHHESRVDDEARARCVDHLAAAADLLTGGEPRLRWYEMDLDAVPATVTRARNRELSTFTGAVNAVAPPMVITAEEGPGGRRELVGRVRLDRTREGPPRSVHGGVVAGLFDELLGTGQRLDGRRGGVTARLTVRYKRPTPLERDLELHVWIERERGRLIVVRGECWITAELEAHRADGGPPPAPTAEAEAQFLEVDFSAFEAAAAGPAGR